MHEGKRRGVNSYQPLAAYGMIGDRRSAALVSSTGSIDWCCMPRFDSGAVFCRLLDRRRGGHFALSVAEAECERRYLEGTMVLETRIEGEGGALRLLDFFAPPEDGEGPRIVRIAEGVEGSVELRARLEPRFDYGQVEPWIRRGGEGAGLFAAIGGDDGLLIRSELELELNGRHTLEGAATLAEGERLRVELAYRRPTALDSLDDLEPLDPEAVDECLDRTAEWWREWARCAEGEWSRPSPGRCARPSC